MKINICVLSIFFLVFGCNRMPIEEKFEEIKNTVLKEENDEN